MVILDFQSVNSDKITQMSCVEQEEDQFICTPYIQIEQKE
jgi:hypothetical protein